MDRDLIVARVFDMMGISRDEVVLKWLPLSERICGYWTEPAFPDDELKSFSDEKCTIGMNESTRLTERQIVETLAHELQHHTQWITGRMAVSSSLDSRRRLMCWNGIMYNADPNRPYSEYYRSPWEQDARATEDAAWELYCETYVETQQVA